MSWNFEWKPDLSVQMNAIQEKIKDRTTKALLQAGYKIQGDAKRFAPVDTGHLRAFIGIRFENDIVYVGTNLSYAKYVEYGTGIYAEGGQGRKTPWYWETDSGKYAGGHWTWGQNPQPFLRPAFIMNREWIKEHIAKAIAKGI